MKTRFLLIICSFLSALSVFADAETDKMISRILHDQNNYISAEVRGPSEDQAYSEAIKQLTDKITEYFKEKNLGLPDAVFLSSISNLSQRLISQTNPNRCRVLVYVNKKNLFPIGDQNNSAVLAKTEEDTYTMVTPAAPEEKKSDSSPDVNTKKKPLTPLLARIAAASNMKDIQAVLVDLKKNNSIGGAAAFPIGSIDDFYVVVIDSADTQVAILHCQSGVWRDAESGQTVNPDQYKNCTSYWFTIH